MDASSLVTPGNVRSLHGRRRDYFPHMGAADVRVWRMALDRGLIQADRFEYDVRLGGCACSLVPRDHEQWVMWETLLKKRVDVVAHTRKGEMLIEVKPVASFGGLGQALGYGDLWQRERGAWPHAGVAVVCEFVDPDLEATFRRFGVAVYTLPPS